MYDNSAATIAASQTQAECGDASATEDCTVQRWQIKPVDDASTLPTYVVYDDAAHPSDIAQVWLRCVREQEGRKTKADWRCRLGGKIDEFLFARSFVFALAGLEPRAPSPFSPLTLKLRPVSDRKAQSNSVVRKTFRCRLWFHGRSPHFAQIPGPCSRPSGRALCGDKPQARKKGKGCLGLTSRRVSTHRTSIDNRCWDVQNVPSRDPVGPLCLWRVSVPSSP